MNSLLAGWIETRLGPMIAVADTRHLLILEFSVDNTFSKDIKRLEKKYAISILQGENKIIKTIKAELKNYFSGKNLTFQTPIKMTGTAFQKNVWKMLQTIPAGETISYLEEAKKIKKPTACRAVANANSANPLAIIVPCHRVINHNGKLGGYRGGVSKKEWLIQHEKNAINTNSG